jgi:phosphoribosylanthranilate isomerase
VGAIVDQQRRCGVNTIQLCDELAVEQLKRLRRELPGVHIVQVIHVMDETAIEEASTAADGAHALLLDSGNPQKKIKELGGTGRVHDWSISRKVRESVNVPVFLAGGLNPDNIAGAIRQVRPYGVDVCSGLRSNGHLDPDKLRSFIHNVHTSLGGLDQQG